MKPVHWNLALIVALIAGLQSVLPVLTGVWSVAAHALTAFLATFGGLLGITSPSALSPALTAPPMPDVVNPPAARAPGVS